MGNQTATSAIFIALLIATVVAVDVLFLRNSPWTRLVVNVGIVAVFGALYWLFLRRR